MMRFCFPLLLFLVLISCDSESTFDLPAERYFVKFYGDDGDHEGIDFVVNSDGSFVLLGNAKVAGETQGQQIYLVKIDALGNVIWQRTFGMKGDEFAKDIELAVNGNLIIAAESEKELGDRDVFIKTVSAAGVPLDSVRIGLKTLENQNADEEVNSISIIQNGFIVSGSTTAVKTQKISKPNDIKDALHLRFTNSLDLIDPSSGQWKNSSGLDDSDDVLIKVFEINASTYYGFGYTNTFRKGKSDYKYWAFSLGATGDPTNNGTELLDNIGNELENEKLSSVIMATPQAGEGFVLSGIKRKINNESQSFVVKLQENLFVPGEDNVLREESPTDLGKLDDLGSGIGRSASMTSLAAGGYLLLSNSKLLSNDRSNISLIKLGNTFLKEWQEPVFFGGIGDDFAGSVAELPNGRIVVIGTMTLGGVGGQKKIVFMKLNSNGRVEE